MRCEYTEKNVERTCAKMLLLKKVFIAIDVTKHDIYSKAIIRFTEITRIKRDAICLSQL